MKETVADILIHLGINFGFTLFFFGILYGVVSCIIKCYNHGDHHEHNNNDDHVTSTIMECVGIKPFVLRSIPIVEFNSKDFKDVVECVVCLSELVDGDKARALPSCDHWFHVECIDSWLQSDSTCPICRKRLLGAMRNETGVPNIVGFRQILLRGALTWRLLKTLIAAEQMKVHQI